MWKEFPDSIDNFFVLQILKKYLNVDYSFSTLEKADFVIKSVFPPDCQFSSKSGGLKNLNQKTIHIIGENWNSVDLKNHDYTIGFDYIEDERYYRFPVWLWTLNYSEIIQEGKYLEKYGSKVLINFKDKHLERNIDMSNRPLKACAFINNGQSKDRLMFIEQLRLIMPVDVYGSYSGGQWIKDKRDLKDNYQFIVCFENSIYPGYHTEKLPEAYRSEMIPIYNSANTYSLDFNKECLIFRGDFDSDLDLAKYIGSLTLEEKNRIVNSPMVKKEIEIEGFIEFLRKIVYSK